jgi:hypothetical protein
MKTMPHVRFAAVLLVSGAAGVAALAQEGTRAPGEPTQARVWIQNRQPFEAVPVAIAPGSPPLRVQVADMPDVRLRPDTVVRSRPVRATWEYRGIPIPSGEDGVARLNAAGAEGWEATGVTTASPTGTIVIMKRPRQEPGEP